MAFFLRLRPAYGLALLLAAGAANATVLAGTVTSVVDGDTVDVRLADGRTLRLRLAAVDAPETSCKSMRSEARLAACVEQAQPGGREAAAWMMRQALGQPAQVRLSGETSYGRQVGQLLIGGRDLGWELLVHGHGCYAERYRNALPEADRNRYAEAQRQAQQQQRGMWARPGAVCAWQWRQAAR